MSAAVALAALVAVTSSAPDRDPDVVRKSFVIMKATPSYAEARALAAAAAERLAIRLDLRELAPDSAVGLTFPKEPATTSSASTPATFRAAAGTTASTSASSIPARTRGSRKACTSSCSRADRPAIGRSARRCAGRRASTRTFS